MKRVVIMPTISIDDRLIRLENELDAVKREKVILQYQLDAIRQRCCESCRAIMEK